MIAKKCQALFLLKLNMTPKINEPPGPKRSASLYQIIPGVKAKNENPKIGNRIIGWLMKSASLYQPSISTTEYFFFPFLKYIFGCPEKSFSPMSSSKDVIFLSLIYPPPWEISLLDSP